MGPFMFILIGGGSVLPDVAKKAIMFAKPRWSDESYAVRIIVDQLTKDSRDELTGAGLMLKPIAEDEYNHGSPSVIIDLVHKVLIVLREDGYEKKFSEITN